MPTVRTSDAQQLIEAVIAKYQRECNVYLKEGKQQFFNELAKYLNALPREEGSIDLNADSLYRHYHLKLKRWKKPEVNYRLPILDRLSNYAYGKDFEKKFVVVTGHKVPPIPTLEGVRLLILCDQADEAQAEKLNRSLLRSGYLHIELKYRDVLKTDELQELIQWNNPSFFVINLIDQSYFKSENYLRRVIKMRSIHGEKYFQKFLHIILPGFVKIEDDASNFFTLKTQLTVKKYWQDYVDGIEEIFNEEEIERLPSNEREAISGNKEFVTQIKDNVLELMEKIRRSPGTLPFDLCLTDQGKEKLFSQIKSFLEEGKQERKPLLDIEGTYWIYHVFPGQNQLRQSFCKIGQQGELVIRTLSSDYVGSIRPSEDFGKFHFHFHSPIKKGFNVEGNCQLISEPGSPPLMKGNFQLLEKALQEEAGMEQGPLYFESVEGLDTEEGGKSIDLQSPEFLKASHLPQFKAHLGKEIKKIIKSRKKPLASASRSF